MHVQSDPNSVAKALRHWNHHSGTEIVETNWVDCLLEQKERYIFLGILRRTKTSQCNIQNIQGTIQNYPTYKEPGESDQSQGKKQLWDVLTLCFLDKILKHAVLIKHKVKVNTLEMNGKNVSSQQKNIETIKKKNQMEIIELKKHYMK